MCYSYEDIKGFPHIKEGVPMSPKLVNLVYQYTLRISSCTFIIPDDFLLEMAAFVICIEQDHFNPSIPLFIYA